MNLREQGELYREAMGDEAYVRQLVEGGKRYICCGEFRGTDHHPDCKANPKRKAERNYRKHFGDTLS